MKKEILSLITILSLIIFSGSVSAVVVDVGDSPIRGNIDAPVTVVHFADYQGPFNKRFYDDTLPQIGENYIEPGKVKYVVKEFPLTSIHPLAGKAAEASHCIREQGGDLSYYLMFNLLFQSQGDFSVANFKQLAEDAGANSEIFDDCLDSGKYAFRLEIDKAYGESLGVRGTPAFFINGELLSGAQPYEAFEEAIDEALANTDGERISVLEGIVQGLRVVIAGILELLGEEPPAIPVCGNGIIEGGEECEFNPLDLDGQTCQTQGFDTGILSCTAQCEFDISQCENIAESNNIKFRTFDLGYGSGNAIAHDLSCDGSELTQYGRTGGACFEFRCNQQPHLEVPSNRGTTKIFIRDEDNLCVCNDGDDSGVPRRYSTSDNDASKVDESGISMDPSFEVSC